MNKFSKYWKALTYAVEKYDKLKRKSSKIPYIIHPLRITLILRAVGYSEFNEEDLMIAAIFHDLIEDTEIKSAEIKEKFGEKVALIVEELSKPEDKDKEDWLKNFGRASKEAKVIKMADRIDNLMEMETWSLERKKTYAKQGKIILNKCGDSNEQLAQILKEKISDILDYSK